MNNRSKSSTSVNDRSKSNGGKLLNQLTQLLNTMTMRMEELGAISNQEKETTTFTNR